MNSKDSTHEHECNVCLGCGKQCVLGHCAAHGFSEVWHGPKVYRSFNLGRTNSWVPSLQFAAIHRFGVNLSLESFDFDQCPLQNLQGPGLSNSLTHQPNEQFARLTTSQHIEQFVNVSRFAKSLQNETIASFQYQIELHCFVTINLYSECTVDSM